MNRQAVFLTFALALAGCDTSVIEKALGTNKGCATTWQLDASGFGSDHGNVQFDHAGITLEHRIPGPDAGCRTNLSVTLAEHGLPACQFRFRTVGGELDEQGRMIVDDVALMANTSCSHIDDQIYGSYEPGDDFYATLELDGSINDGSAALACVEGSIMLRFGGTMVRRGGVIDEANPPAAEIVLEDSYAELTGQFQSRGTPNTCI
jgi:hypothetical protein